MLVCTQAGWRSTQQKNRKKMVTKVQWVFFWKIHDSWVAYFRTQSRLSLHWFYGRAQQSWDRFDECDPQKLRSVMQTSENKGPSLGKIQVKDPHRRSPYALKFEDGSQEETARQERCVCGDAWRLAKEYLKAQRKGQSFFFLTYQRLVSPGAIRDKTGGKRTRWRFGSINAHVEQERLQLCRVGYRKDLWKSDDDCNSQRRGANKRRSDSVAVLSLVKLCEDHGSSYEWTSGQKPQLIKDGRRIKMQHGELRTDRCPWFIGNAQLHLHLRRHYRTKP